MEAVASESEFMEAPPPIPLTMSYVQRHTTLGQKLLDLVNNIATTSSADHSIGTLLNHELGLGSTLNFLRQLGNQNRHNQIEVGSSLTTLLLQQVVKVVDGRTRDPVSTAQLSFGTYPPDHPVFSAT